MRIAQVAWTAAVLLLVGQLYTPGFLAAAPSASSELTAEMALLRGGKCYVAPAYTACTCVGLPGGECKDGGCTRTGPGFQESDYTCDGPGTANGRTSSLEFSDMCPDDDDDGKKSCGKTGFNCCLWDVCGACEFSEGQAVCKSTGVGGGTPKDRYAPSGQDCSS